ncbi:MAG: biotin transporter BioY [Planctomycetes bacterium]|nr:biotin transporter BioY [Planctomycetota bacterium]
MQAKTLPEILPLTENHATSTLVWTVGFAILTAAGAQLALPTIPVPMTLQTPFVLLAGALLGARIGAWSQLTYLAAGTMLPVFANGAGGMPYLAATPTIGYLLGFPVAALVTGALVGRGGYLRTVLAMTLGMTPLHVRHARPRLEGLLLEHRVRSGLPRSAALRRRQDRVDGVPRDARPAHALRVERLPSARTRHRAANAVLRTSRSA